MTTDVAADGSAPIQQSPTDRAVQRARETIAGHPHGKDAASDLVLAWLANRAEIHASDVLALTQAAQPAEADGWVMVPREPAIEMLAAWWRQKNCGTQEPGKYDPNHMSDCDAYRAMLAATTKAPATDAGEVKPVAWLCEHDDYDNVIEPASKYEPWRAPITYADSNAGWRAVPLFAATPPAPNDDLRAAATMARDLLDTVKQSPGNVWFVDADDPETAVCDTYSALEKALKETRRG